MNKTQSIEPYLKSGKLKVFPAKRKNKDLVLKYLIEKFQYNVKYTEKEVNKIIENNLLFEGTLLLRREMVDIGYLARTLDGSVYWRVS